MNAEFKKHLPYLVLIMAALLLAFSPAILTIYPFHDDMYFWQLPFSPKRFPMMCYLTIYVGRILGAFILWFDYYFINTVPDLNMVRLFNSVAIACCALGAYGILFKYLKKPIDAALSVIMIFSLPAFEVWSFHVGQSCELYAAVFVMIALYAVDAIPVEGAWQERIMSEAGVIAIMSLVLSNLIYPSLASLYWAMAVILILVRIESGSRGLRGKLENIYLSGITATVIFACFFKLRKYFFNFSVKTAYTPDSVVSNLSDKSGWFFHTVIPRSLNLWNIFSNKFLPACIILFLMGAVAVTLIKESRKADNKDLWLKIIGGGLITSSLTVLSYWPNLLCALNFDPYRCSEGLTAIFIIFLIWALRIYCQCLPAWARSSMVTIVLSIACIWGLWRCFDNINRFRVEPSSLEYSYLKSSINNFHGKLKEIYIVPAAFDDLYSYYDEFGVSRYSFDSYNHAVNFISAMLIDVKSQDNMKWVNVERFASPEELKYRGPNPSANNSTYKYYFKDMSAGAQAPYSTFEVKIALGPKPKGKIADSTLLIDMNDLYGPLKKIMGAHYNFKASNKGSWSGDESG